MATVTKPIALDESFNTTEVTPRNIADVLAEGFSHITGRTASEVEYDNTDSGLTSDDVQGAIDELSERPTLPSVDIQTAVDEFSTYNGGLLSSLKVSLSPNQDLHGYDSPWVGGAGKNKLEDTFNTGTLLGVDITADNGVIDLNGTGTNNNNFAIKSRNTSGNYIYMPKGNYIFSAEGIGSGVVVGTTYNGAFSEIARNDGGESAGFSITDNTQSDYKLSDGSVLVGLFINIKEQTYSHQKVYPMIRLASDTDPTFEPYSNICPISGHTQVEVENHQENLCDDSLIVQGDIDNSTGADTADGSLKHIRSGYCNAESSTQYTVSHNHTIGSGTLKVFEYRSDKSFIRRTNAGVVTSLSYTFTTHIECKYIRIAIYDENGINKDSTWIQLELGSTATAYEPYNGYQVTVNLGGTYYSGTLDVVTGVFTPDTAVKDLSTLTFRSASRNRWLSDSIISEVKHPSSSTLKIKFWSDSYYYTDAQNLYDDQTLIGIAVDNDGNILCRNGDNVNTPTGYIVYELATPTPIQLSPTMVKALVGENHLSAPLDGQEITESKYKQTFTFDDVIAYIQSLS